MRQLISQVLKTATFRQTVITTISTFASAGLGAVFYLLMARLMPPSDYGLFTLATTSALMAISIADLGSGQSLIRFAGQNLAGHGYFPFALISLRLKVIAGVVSLAAFYVFARPLANSLLHQPALVSLMPYAGLATLSMLLISFPADLARGLQKFLLWGGIQIGSNILRLALLGGLFLGALITPQSSLLIFALAPLAVFFVSWTWLDKGILHSHISSDQVRHFWSFNRWTAAFIISSAITSRLDTFVSARYLGLEQLGIYGLATTMATFMPQLSGAFGAVTSAKFASFTDADHSARYLKKGLLFTTTISLVVAAAMIPTAMFVIWFTGGAYAASLTPFLILLSALVLFTSLTPLRDSIFYYHARPDLFLWTSLAQSAVILLVGSQLIPRFGVVGSSLTVLLSLVFLSIVNIFYYLRLTAAKGS